MALTRQCGLPDGPYPVGATPEQWPDKKTRERDILWLDEVDRRIEAVHLRQFLATPAVAREEGLRIFLKRHLLKPEKQTSDRDKIDLLIVQYFVLCAPQELIARRIEFADVAKVLRPCWAKWRRHRSNAANRWIEYWKPRNSAAVCAIWSNKA
jgi:hypothetical protein